METKKRFIPVLPETKEAQEVYEAPVVTIIDVKVEKGFAGSDEDDLSSSPDSSKKSPIW